MWWGMAPQFCNAGGVLFFIRRSAVTGERWWAGLFKFEKLVACLIFVRRSAVMGNRWWGSPFQFLEAGGVVYV